MPSFWRRVGIATLAATAIVVSAPFVGQIRSALQSALPSAAYRAVVGSIVAGAVLCALVAAVVRIRDRRGLRYGALALSLAIGVAYASLTATGNANVDLVERVHFVEYGLLALLFFRVWREREDASMFVAPVLACVTVACADEWLQWFVPARVGEIRDVALNTVAVGCGLLIALGLDLPARAPLGLSRRSFAEVAWLSAVTILAVALFIDAIHLGHEIALGSSTLRSRYTGPELDALAADRAERWRRDGPPLVLHRVSREDQYLAEGIWHVQHRNEAASGGNLLAAWHENLILERFFPPVLEWPSYAAKDPSRWPAAQRENTAAEAGKDDRPYISRAEPFPLFTWSRAPFWASVAAALCVVAGDVEMGSGLISRSDLI